MRVLPVRHLSRWEEGVWFVTATFRGDQAQPRLEDVLEDKFSNSSFLVHVFLNELDQELVDLDLEGLRNELKVGWNEHAHNFLERGTRDNRILSLRKETDELS